MLANFRAVMIVNGVQELYILTYWEQKERIHKEQWFSIPSNRCHNMQGEWWYSITEKVISFTFFERI